jgi:hypothetical protein
MSPKARALSEAVPPPVTATENNGTLRRTSAKPDICPRISNRVDKDVSSPLIGGAMNGTALTKTSPDKNAFG